MPDVAGADAFLADLLDGLDDAAFSSPTASGSFRPKQPATTTPGQPHSQPRKRLKATQSATAKLASSPSHRALPSPSPLGPGTSPAPSRLLAIPPTPQPFWNNPFARRKLSPAALRRRDGQTADENRVAVSNATPTRAKRSRHHEASSPVKSGAPSAPQHETGRGFDIAAPKRVEIEVDQPHRPKRQALAEKGLNVEAPATGPVVTLLPPQSDTDYFDDDFPLDESLWDQALESAAAAETGAAIKEKLALTPRCRQFTRCTVEEVTEESENGSPRKLLSVSSDAVEGTRSLILEDDWIDTPVRSGDTVNVLGENGSYDLTSLEPVVISRTSRKLLVLHPDILVSSTKAADSSHCTRKAVLQELIRTVGETTPSLIYGNMLHSLMQACMLENRWNDAFRDERIQQIVKDSGAQLWSVNVSFAKAQEELAERSKEFEAFADRFMGLQPKPDAFLSDSYAKESDRSRLAIACAVAEEEDIWSPRTGLKGKIDVTTLASFSRADATDLPGPVPFEIKTGRTNAGMEHRAQTMLYTLLLEDRYDQDVQTGLLMYTQSNDVFAVKRRDNELRGLMQARNRFASVLHDRMTHSSAAEGTTGRATESASGSVQPPAPTSPAMSEGEAALWEAFRSSPAPPTSTTRHDSLLPPPIDETRACRRCHVGNACRVFRRAAGGVDDGPANDELAQLHENAVGHLDDVEATFFARWERLISFEEQELARYKKEIWTLHAAERESLGRCFANMVVAEDSIAATVQADVPPAGTTAKSIHRFTYRMRRHPVQASEEPVSLLGGAISPNDPVVVSLEHPPVLAVARGFVLSTSLHEVVLGLDRSITQMPQLVGRGDASAVYRIDKDELAAGMGRLRDNLLQLFYADAQTKRRKLIVGLAEPRFDDRAAADAHRVMPTHLNPDQKAAVEKVLSAQDYALILGMPGTGKTTTTAEIIKALARAGRSILLTSYTHSAVDNILLKLVDGDGPSILRLGNHDKILPSLRPYALTPADYATSLDVIEEKLMAPQVVATTCLGINEPIFAKRRFDVCIVDEASQVTLPTCLGPLRFADRFVLVGDHYQLPPLVRNKAALEGGLDVSLFKRLSEAHPAAVINLTRQYRMNDDIMSLSNTLVYGNFLRSGDEAIGRRLLTLPEASAAALRPDWIREIIDPKRSVLFVDTDLLPARERRDGSLIDNPVEAELVNKIVAGLSTCGISEDDIAVLTPYRQQVKLLASQLASYPAVEVLTADRSQGRDKDCIIISLVRSNTTKNAGDLLKDRRRINVCLTRAKCKLVIVGSRSTVSNAPVMSELLDLVVARSWLYSMPSASLAVSSFQSRPSTAGGAAIKTPRRGGGSLAMKRPLHSDILDSL